MKARLRSEVELYLQIQAEAWFELETAFHWQSKRLGFPFEKEKKQHNIYSADLGFRVVTDSHKQYTQMITPIKTFGSLILLLLFIFTFPRTTDKSIHSLVTILRVAINVGNPAFHMAAGRSYRTQTPMYLRILSTCSVANFQTILEV